jgi:hypothetical protein
MTVSVAYDVICADRERVVNAVKTHATFMQRGSHSARKHLRMQNPACGVRRDGV